MPYNLSHYNLSRFILNGRNWAFRSFRLGFNVLCVSFDVDEAERRHSAVRHHWNVLQIVWIFEYAGGENQKYTVLHKEDVSWLDRNDRKVAPEWGKLWLEHTRDWRGDQYVCSRLRRFFGPAWHSDSCKEQTGSIATAYVVWQRYHFVTSENKDLCLASRYHPFLNEEYSMNTSMNEVPSATSAASFSTSSN